MQKSLASCGVAAAGLVGVATITSGAEALAADLSGNGYGYEVQAPQYVPQPYRRSFYVRGDVGIGRFSGGEFSQEDLELNEGSFLEESIEDTVYIGFGIGWQASARLRFDLTGEYRSTADIKAMDTLSAELVAPAGTLQANTLYDGNIKSYVGLLNVYWDLFHARGFTPYVGAGAGFAHNILSDVTTMSGATFTDAAGVITTELSHGTSRDNSETGFAWALMAGTSYDISPNAKLDLGYRYLNLGTDVAASSDILNCVCGATGKPLEISDLDAHEIRIGIRWSLSSGSYEGNPLK